MYGLQLSAARRVHTRMGERTVQTATPTEEFWSAWRAGKDAMKAHGYSVEKRDGRWLVTIWSAVDPQAAAAARAASAAIDADVTVPAPAGREYLPYQRAGIAYALARPATLIADEMGLGKTIQAIGVINSMKAERVLIICPASLKLNWSIELKRWLTVERTIGIAVGDSLPNRQIVVINYDIVARHIDALRATTWDVLVIDEAHYLKSQDAQRTRAILGHEDRKTKKATPGISAKRKLFLTGTPIVNRPRELWTLIHSLDPVAWRNFFGFAKRYCGATHNGYGWDFSGASNLAELQTRLRETIMVRRLKADVLTELPPKRRQVVVLAANGLAPLVAEESRAIAALADYADGEALYQALSRLRSQSASFDKISRLRHKLAVAKLPKVIEHLDDLAESVEKLVVFGHHREVVQGIAEHFGNAAVLVSGDTPMAARQAAVERFQTDPTCRVFVGHMVAAGVGLTLTAASTVVFAELDWVPGNITQAEDRCHRIGQRNSVLVQHLVLDNSLDARLVETIIAKQAVIGEALDSGAEVVAAPVATAAPVELPPLPVVTGKTEVGLGRIREMLVTASTHKRTPRISLGGFVISLASMQSRNPGCLYVKQDGEYLGKVTASGHWSPAQGCPDSVADRLKAIAEDPVKVLGGYGRETMCCVFCSQELTDPRSRAVGYGETCASNHGLPWGA